MGLQVRVAYKLSVAIVWPIVTETATANRKVTAAESSSYKN